MTPPPPAQTSIARIQTEQAFTPDGSQQVIVPPAQQTADALTTAIIRGATREAEARARQTQTGPPPTATPPPPLPTWTPPSIFERWWEITPSPAPIPSPRPPQPFSIKLSKALLVLDTNPPSGQDVQPDFPPDLILYGDGTLIKSSRTFSSAARPQTKRLSRGEMCSLLYAVDRLGFLDLGSLNFPSPVRNLQFPDVVLLSRGRQPAYLRAEQMDAWLDGIPQESFVDACQDFGRWGYDPGPNFYCYLPPPAYPDAFVQAYQFLRDYDPGGLEPLKPARLLVWVQRVNESQFPSLDMRMTVWPLSEPTLRQIYRRARMNASAGSEGWSSFVTSDPDWVEAMWNRLDGVVYFQDSLGLMIVMRPLWPDELPQGGFDLFDLVNPRFNSPELECTPEDAALEP